jgi:hypothetical protein
MHASAAALAQTTAATVKRTDVAEPTPPLPKQLLAIHAALSAAGLRHAFGGAIALAYCTHQPRSTQDLDVNVFVAPKRAGEVLDALPEGVARSAEELASAQAEGQVRLWWQDTPIDIFLNSHSFHQEVERGVRIVPFAGTVIPVVGCTTLAVFKSVISRTKDWADIEEMLTLGELNLSDALAWIAQIVGAEDPAVARLRALGA